MGRDYAGNVVGMKPSTLPRGHSDIAGILPGGKAFFCEVKASGKKPTPDQQDFIDRVNAQGGLAFWADDLDVVVDKLQNYQ